jgi:hypothetical protein
MKRQEAHKPLGYFHWSVRLTISVFVAWYLNTPTQYKSFFTLIKQSNYQEAVLFSFLTATIIMSGVHYSSLYLDRRLLWEEKPLLRTVAQLSLGVGAMIFATYLAVSCYFNVVDGDLELSDYMVLEFPIVQAGILMLNVLYLCYYIIVKNLMPQHYEKHLKGTLGRNSFFIPVGDIGYLVREGKEGYAVLKKNKTLHIAYKMTELETLLDPQKFFRVNRSLMVSLDVVAGYKPVKNMQCVLLLKMPVPPGIDLVVTRNRTEQLKQLLESRSLNIREMQKVPSFRG